MVQLLAVLKGKGEGCDYTIGCNQAFIDAYGETLQIAQAQAEAEAIRIQAEAVKSQGGAEYVQLKAIEKWNGALPTYMMGNQTPIINLK